MYAAMAIRLLLLTTGCRKSEILNLQWDHVDLKAGEMRLRDSKTGPRAVQLSPAAAAVLARISRILPDDAPGQGAGKDPGRCKDAREGAGYVDTRARPGTHGPRSLKQRAEP